MKPTIQQSTLDLIEGFEGCVLSPYQDIRGVWTIGIGFTRLNGVVVAKDTPSFPDIQSAKEALKVIVQPYGDAITACIKITLTQNQYDALVSLCYNEGISAIKNSTLIRDLNAGLIQEAADQFLEWDIPAILLARRQKERILFLTN